FRSGRFERFPLFRLCGLNEFRNDDWRGCRSGGRFLGRLLYFFPQRRLDDWTRWTNGFLLLFHLRLVFAHDDAARARRQFLACDQRLDHVGLENLTRVVNVRAERLQLEDEVLLGLAHPLCNITHSKLWCRHSISLDRPWEKNLLHLGLFLLLFVFALSLGHGFGAFAFFTLFVARQFFFFAALRFFDLLVFARDLDDLRGRVFVDAFDGDEVFGTGVDDGVEIVVSRFFEFVGPLARHLVDVVNVGLGALIGHRFLQHRRERVGHFALHFLFRLDVDLRADQLGGQTNIQSALADGQRELIVVDDDIEMRTMRRFVARHRDARGLCRRQ